MLIYHYFKHQCIIACIVALLNNPLKPVHLNPMILLAS